MTDGFPVQKNDRGFWFVWSMRSAHTVNRAAADLELFPTYGEGRRECIHRNLEIARLSGSADIAMTKMASDEAPMTWAEFSADLLS